MGFFANKGCFFDASNTALAHRAKYGTANSTSSEKGTDNKKNNTSEYNHQYYEKNKNKWAKEKKYDQNDDDEDFKKVYGDDLKNPKLNTNTRIQGTDFYTVTNKDGQVVLINGDKKWTLPKGVTLTDQMKTALAGINSNQGKQGNEFLGKMAEFLDKAKSGQYGSGSSTSQGDSKINELNQQLADAYEKASGKESPTRKTTASKEKSSSSKKSSKKSDTKEKTEEKKDKEEKTEETKDKEGMDYEEAKRVYYQEKDGKTYAVIDKVSEAQRKGQNQTEYYKKKEEEKKKTVKHYDDLGSILVRDLF